MDGAWTGEFGIDVTDEEVSTMSENKFKTIVNAAVTERTLKYLNKIADGHSKSKILVKAKVEREKYLDDPRFSRSDAELLFCLRTRMLDFKMNFSNKYGDDISCRICHVQVECQEHILKCEPLKDKIEVPNNVVYEDIFKNPDKQLEAVKVIKKMLREREIQMNT